MAAKGALPSYLGGGMPALGYFPDFMPGQQGALASQLAAGYQYGTKSAAADGLVKDKLAGSRADYMAYLDKMYSPMGAAVPKPVAKPAVVAPTVKPKPKPKPKIPTKKYPRYVSPRW